MPGRDPLDKRYYKPSEVAGMLGVPTSTLRFWETEFSGLSPKRSRGGARLYTSADLRRLQVIHYLLHIKGLKIEAARKALAANPDGYPKDAQVVVRLRDIRSRLQELIDALSDDGAIR